MSYTARLESSKTPQRISADASVPLHRKRIQTLGAVASPRMGRRSLNFEAPPQPAPVDASRTRDLRVEGFPQQTTSTTAAVPVATIAVPENQASEANGIFRRMRSSDKRRRER